jgi:hypothetical protein
MHSFEIFRARPRERGGERLVVERASKAAGESIPSLEWRRRRL